MQLTDPLSYAPLHRVYLEEREGEGTCMRSVGEDAMTGMDKAEVSSYFTF